MQTSGNSNKMSFSDNETPNKNRFTTLKEEKKLVSYSFLKKEM